MDTAEITASRAALEPRVFDSALALMALDEGEPAAAAAMHGRARRRRGAGDQQYPNLRSSSDGLFRFDQCSASYVCRLDWNDNRLA
jgi:hypothetical protein